MNDMALDPVFVLAWVLAGALVAAAVVGLIVRCVTVGSEPGHAMMIARHGRLRQALVDYFANDHDSSDPVELVMVLEDRLGIAVPDRDYAKITTVRDAIRYFDDRLFLT